MEDPLLTLFWTRTSILDAGPLPAQNGKTADDADPPGEPPPVIPNEGRPRPEEGSLPGEPASDQAERDGPLRSLQEIPPHRSRGERLVRNNSGEVVLRTTLPLGTRNRR